MTAALSQAAARGVLAQVYRDHRPPIGMPIQCSCGATGDYVDHLAGEQATALASLDLLRGGSR